MQPTLVDCSRPWRRRSVARSRDATDFHLLGESLSFVLPPSLSTPDCSGYQLNERAYADSSSCDRWAVGTRRDCANSVLDDAERVREAADRICRGSPCPILMKLAT